MYELIVIADILFGSQFLTNKKYLDKMGSGWFSTMFLYLCGGVVGSIILLAINRFSVEYTPFTLLMSCVGFLNGILFTLCSLKSLEYVNLSTYSLYSMLGGMLLPLIVGVAFYEEPMTLGITLCVAFIAAAIVLTVCKKSTNDAQEKTKQPLKKRLLAFCFLCGIFTFNGMAGVISKIYTEAPYAKASSSGYSLLSSIITVVISAVVCLCISKNRPKIDLKSTGIAVIGSVGNRIANYLLLLALAVLPASVNYPMVTGGTIIVSTILSYFTDKKPRRVDWLAVGLAFIGIMFLTLLPI